MSGPLVLVPRFNPEDRLSDTLSWQEEAFALGLLACKTVDEAGKDAGISHATSYRWQKKPEIQAFIVEVQKSLRNRGMMKLYRATDESVDLLLRARTDPEVTPTMLKATMTHLEKVGFKMDDITRVVGDENQPIVLKLNVPYNPNAAQEQQERERIFEAQWSPVDDVAMLEGEEG